MSKKKKEEFFLQEESLNDYVWLIKDNDIEMFMMKRIKKATFTFFFVLLSYEAICFGMAYFNGAKINPMTGFALAFIFCYVVFKWDFWKLKSSFKKKKKNVYESFPLWVSILEILIMTNNIPNTFKKSIPSCPEAFKADLIEFVKKIEVEPENKDHYKDFLRRYKLEDVSEIIMDMYAFNKLEKSEIVKEFENVNARLNKIKNRTRQEKQNVSLFGISALNSIPLFTVCIWILLVSMLINIG